MALWWFIAFVGYAALAAAVIVFLRAQRLPATDDEEARCGFCGYRTRGLPTSTCPECGRDLNVVGIRRPTSWNRLTPAQRPSRLCAAWTIGIGGLALAAWPPLQELRSGVRWMSDCVTLREPGGAYHVEVERAWRVRGWGNGYPSTPRAGSALAAWAVSVHGPWNRPDARGVVPAYLFRPEALLARKDEVTFVIDPRRLRYAYANPSTGMVVHSEGPDWRTRLDAWLDAVARQRNQPSLRTDVTTILNSALSGPYFPPPSTTFAAFRWYGNARGWAWEPDRSWVFVAIGLVVLIWLAGCLTIRHVYRAREVAE